MRDTKTARPYTRAERLSDAVIHILGLGAALMAVPTLIALSVVWRGDVSTVAAVAVYGLTLVAMLGCSAAYHMYRHPEWRGLLRRLDHAAIYFKIAGTYTPFTLLSGGQGLALLTGLWGAALAGTGLQVFAHRHARWPGLVLYLAMGWAGVVAGWSMLATLSGPVIALLLVGGLIYTAGVGFFLMERMPFHNTVWHAFVLVASGVLFAAVALHLAQTSAPPSVHRSLAS